MRGPPEVHHVPLSSDHAMSELATAAQSISGAGDNGKYDYDGHGHLGAHTDIGV